MLMNPALRDFWSQQTRYKVLYGGRASSKSHDACGRLIYATNKIPLKILAVRQFQSNIRDSVYTLLNNKIEAFGYKDNFTKFQNSIKNDNGSEFLFYGINRNIEEIKSTEDVDILYIEEAHSLTEMQWEILKPTIRKEGSEIWLVFNPRLVTDFVYKRFIINTPKDCIKRHINYTENPFLSDTARIEIEEAREEDEEKYNHIYLGHPKVDDNEAIIKRSWIEAAIDAHLVLDVEIVGSHKIGYDVADDGDDKLATVEAQGILAFKIDEWKGKEDELEESALKVFRKAKVNRSIIIYDGIGIGASAGSTFKRLNKDEKYKLSYSGYNAGEKALNPEQKYKDTKMKNKDFFANLKAQSWWDLAERFKNTYNAVTKGKSFKEDEIISISSTIEYLDQLKEELATPRKSEDNIGRVKVESKKDLKKRGIPSPNIADAFVMAYAKPKVNPLLQAMSAK